MLYVYVLQSDSDSGLYIGFTADLKKRFAQHRRGTSFATSYRGPWKLIYYEAYLNREDAEGRAILEERLRTSFFASVVETPLRKFPSSTGRVRRSLLRGLHSR